MKLRTTFWLGSCAILVLGLGAKAQDFGGAAGGAGLAGGAAGAPPAAPAGANLFTMLLPPPDMAERCRQKLCKCEIVKLLKASLGPASAATGGIIPVGNCCPTVKKEDLAKPAESSEGAAARIMKDAEEAAARRAAVRYLGTVDCRYWPEAEDALINALRADKIECVRYEAAVALQRGCCCTKKIAKHLTYCIEGSEKDGHPAERSCRVQDAAAMALSRCVFEDRSEKKDEKDADKKQQARVDPKEFQRNLEKESMESVQEAARKVLEKRSTVNSTQVISQSHRAASQGLFGIFSHAVESSNESAQRASGTREPQMSVAANAQPQRRGLLYKFMPGSALIDEPIVYNAPTPVAQPVSTAQSVTMIPTVTTAQPVVQPVKTAQPLRMPVTNEIRPVGYVAPVRGTMTTDEPANTGFSTASPNNTPPVSRPSAPTTTSSNTTSRPEGLLGFVIMNDNPARR